MSVVSNTKYTQIDLPFLKDEFKCSKYLTNDNIKNLKTSYFSLNNGFFRLYFLINTSCYTNQLFYFVFKHVILVPPGFLSRPPLYGVQVKCLITGL